MNSTIAKYQSLFERDLSPTASVIIRLLCSLLGGYGIAALACVLLTELLPLSRIDAVLIATMSSFSLFAAMIIRLFSLRSHKRVVLEPLTVCLALYCLTLALG
ncbi:MULTISPECIES: hypothetical protein [Shewanella]|uniref:DUF3649 domain-containing protein n=1 Tax=Shewanella marisflavi TaxID=260364 RepID=A0ABX5WN66_9GAMM|nr:MULTISPECIES: hypothetical protein [Shewanella]QDF76007.1 hypothetical protein FGA12_13080 [Shewanella marisflavi]